MKKLISAAASLAMAASMVGSAVPFITGAADSSKALEIRAFKDVNGKEVSTTISADAIAAGDVTIPIGIFLSEGTNDCDSISAQWTVKSANGDASGVKFVSHETGTDYYAEAQEVTVGDKTASTKSLVGFAGVLKNNKKLGDFFSPTGTGYYFAEAKSESAGTPNAYGSIAWVTAKDGSGYKWSGSKSDDFPIYVQDVVFAKGTPAGTYTIEFLDYVPDKDFPDNMSNMIETSAGKLTTKKSNLTLKNLEITIGEGGTPVETTTTAPAAETTTTKPAVTTSTAPAAETTTSTKKPVDPSLSIDDGFIVTPADAEVEPGQAVDIDIMCENTSGRKVGQFVVRVDNENLPIKGAEATMDDTFCYAVEGNKEYELINGTWYCDTLASGEPQEIDTASAVCQFQIKVPADAKPGEYTWSLDRFHVVENGYEGVEFDAVLKPGKLVVKGDVTPEETTTTTTKPAAETTTTTAPAAETTTTTAPAAETTTTKPVAETTTTAKPGSKLYGDTNCDGKVNIADVVVLNKYLNDAASYKITDQGKINADCCDAKDGAGLDENDSDAIIKSIVHLVKALPCTAADLK